MSRNKFETSLQNEQRSKELRKLNEALKAHPNDESGAELAISAKLAEAILRARKIE